MPRRQFEDVIGRMPEYLQQLKDCELTSFVDGRWISFMPSNDKGMYVFYEDDKPMYVGRSDKLRKRILAHGRPKSGHTSATFAFILAKEEFELACPDCKLESDRLAKFAHDPKMLTPLKNHFRRKNDEVKHSHSKQRAVLEDDPEFKPLYDRAKRRVRNMGVRIVEIEDDIEQAVFEIYAHMKLGTLYNTFENH